MLKIGDRIIVIPVNDWSGDQNVSVGDRGIIVNEGGSVGTYGRVWYVNFDKGITHPCISAILQFDRNDTPFMEDTRDYLEAVAR